MTTAQSGHYVQVNGIDLYYEAQGSGRPLLLLHGGIGNLSMWNDYLPTFAQHCRVFAIDSRGHGRTRNPLATLTYRLLADDVAALIQTLGLDQPAVCGYSDGGQIALELGIHYPGLVSAFVMAGAAHRWTEAYFTWVRELGIEQAGVVDFHHLEGHQAGLIDALRRYQDAFQGDGYWRRYLQQVSTLWLEPLHYTADDFLRIAVPMLIVAGDRDETFLPVEVAVELYRALPQAELALIPGMGHDFPFVEAEMFGQLVLDFLRRHELLKAV
jgi:pimeloyl-ACP methyl ester carboxylesterase